MELSLLKNVLEQINKFGTYKGLVDFDLNVQSLENTHLRKKVGLHDYEEGVLINHIEKGNPLPTISSINWTLFARQKIEIIKSS